MENLLKIKRSCNKVIQIMLFYASFKKLPLQEPNKIKYKVDCIEGGDNHYSVIAAASIIAKVERDKYIEELCENHPELSERYGIDTNKGYGSKKHIEGIKEHGITIWHRRSFGICKDYYNHN
jgi:ribonuclease HII